MSDYIYGPSFSLDDFITSEGTICQDRLRFEVFDAIGKTPWIQMHPESCDVRFNEEITPEEDDDIATIVANHSGEPWNTTDEAQHAADETYSANATESWDAKLSFILDPVVAGAYRVTWFAEYRRGGDETEYCEIRVEAGGTVICKVATNATVWQPANGICCMSLQEGDTPAVVVRYRQLGTGSNPAEIRRVRAVIDRIAACEAP